MSGLIRIQKENSNEFTEVVFSCIFLCNAETRQRALVLGVVSHPDFTVHFHVSSLSLENVLQEEELASIRDTIWSEYMYNFRITSI